MTYLTTLHAYLHQSSLLIHAYPTTRITTKYSLPRKPKPSKSKPTSEGVSAESKIKREPAATLTLKTFHPESGICLKYQTDKAAEVGRLMSGLGRLAKREIIEMPSTAAATSNPAVGAGELLAADRMEVDSGAGIEEKSTVPPQTASQMTAGNGAPQGKGKKKKGKK